MTFNPLKKLILKLLVPDISVITSLQNSFQTAAGSSRGLGDLNGAFVQH